MSDDIYLLLLWGYDFLAANLSAIAHKCLCSIEA